MVQINFSEKTPLIVTGKGIARGVYQFAPGISLVNLASILYAQLGMPVKKPMFGEKLAGKKNNKKNQLLIIAAALVVAIVYLYVFVINK